MDALAALLTNAEPWEIGAAALGLAAVIALVLASLRRRRPPQLPRLRSRVLSGMALVAIVPVLSVAFVVGHQTAEHRLERRAAHTRDATASLANDVDSALDRKAAGVARIAADIAAGGSLAGDAVGRVLLTHHAGHTDFATLVAADAAARVVAATVLVDGAPTRIAHGDTDLKGRPYFVRAMQDGATYISGLLPRHGLGDDFAIAVSTPIVSPDGERIGVVEGAVRLEAFSALAARYLIAQGTDLAILDRDGRVVYASPGAGLATNEAPSQGWVAGDDAEDRFVAARRATAHGWHVVVRRAVGDVVADRQADFTFVMATSLAALLVALLLGAFVTAWIVRPLAWLGDAMRTFDPIAGTSPPVAPPDSPQEVASVVERLRELAERLSASYRELRTAVDDGERLRGELAQVLARRDEDIRLRTTQLEQANASLQKLTRVDSLTGLANRRWFAEFLDQAWRVGVREQVPLAIIIADIDHFKAYNDHYGHQAGDDCLHRVAQAIQRSVARPLDLVARYGGEEFVMVLADTPLEGAVTIGEAVRATVQAMAVPHAGSSFGVVTISVGIASVIPTRDTQPMTFMVAADRALYQAKRDGRNRVAFAPAHPRPPASVIPFAK
jgi:diguanylate cyclase (GGDEF)-like protein